MGAFNNMFSKLSSAAQTITGTAKSSSATSGATIGALGGLAALYGGGDRGFGSPGDKGWDGDYTSPGGYDNDNGYGAYLAAQQAAERAAAEKAQKQNQAQINNTAANYAKRGGELSEEGIDSLKNIQAQITQNENQLAESKRNIMQAIEWQPQQQREQSTEFALRNRLGNGAYGSSLVDLNEGMARVDDMADNALIKAWKENSNAAYSDYYQAYNALRSDYLDQVNSIKDEMSKLYSQYWSTISNIAPELATAANIKKSANGTTSSVGSGTDAYTLPSASGILASKDLQAMYASPKQISATNPMTSSFVRPPRAVNKANKIADTGTANRFTAANQGYNDNLDVYRRRV